MYIFKSWVMIQTPSQKFCTKYNVFCARQFNSCQQNTTHCIKTNTSHLAIDTCIPCLLHSFDPCCIESVQSHAVNIDNQLLPNIAPPQKFASWSEQNFPDIIGHASSKYLLQTSFDTITIRNYDMAYWTFKSRSETPAQPCVYCRRHSNSFLHIDWNWLRCTRRRTFRLRQRHPLPENCCTELCPKILHAKILTCDNKSKVR